MKRYYTKNVVKYRTSSTCIYMFYIPVCTKKLTIIDIKYRKPFVPLLKQWPSAALQDCFGECDVIERCLQCQHALHLSADGMQLWRHCRRMEAFTSWTRRRKRDRSTLPVIRTEEPTAPHHQDSHDAQKRLDHPTHTDCVAIISVPVTTDFRLRVSVIG